MLYYILLGGIFYYFKNDILYLTLNTINLFGNIYNNYNINKKYIDYIENNSIIKLDYNQSNLIYNKNRHTIINFYKNNNLKKIIYTPELIIEDIFNYSEFKSPIISFNIKITDKEYDLTDYLNSLLLYQTNLTLNNKPNNLWLNIINYNHNTNYKNETLNYTIICEDISIYNGESLQIIVKDGKLTIS